MQILKSFILFSCLLITLIKGQSVAYPKPLKITILYEALCSDSQLFFKYQLQHAYPLLKDYINIQYVPFGKSDSHENSYFTCQHGPLECAGNRIQSCTINTISHNQDITTMFTSCFMSSKSPQNMRDINDAGIQCAKLFGIPTEDISLCMNSNDGTKLQLQDERITKSFYGPLRFVPTIVYDDQFDQNLQDHSLSNFRDVICQVLFSKGINDDHLKNVCGQ